MIGLEKANIEDIMPLSPMQEGMLFHYLLNPTSKQYFEQLEISLQGEIITNNFIDSWEAVIKQNNILRSIFRWEKIKQPVQIVLKKHVLDIRITNISDISQDEQKLHIDKIKSSDIIEGFSFETVPFRINLVKLNQENFKLLISFNHILIDGWSLGIVVKEFLNAYESISQDNLKICVKNNYKSYINWLLKESNISKSLPYWKEYLQEAKIYTLDGQPKKHFSFKLNEAVQKKISNYSKKHNISESSLIYATISIFQALVEDDRDIIIGTTISGRPSHIKGIEDMVGLFINSIPLRLNLGIGEKSEILLQKVNTNLIERKDHEFVPLNIINETHKLRSMDSFFNALVVIENYPIDKIIKENVSNSIQITDFKIEETSHYDFTYIVSFFDGFKIDFTYNPLKLNDLLIEKMPEIFVNILDNLTNNINISECLLDEHRKLFKYLKPETTASKSKNIVKVNSTFTSDILSEHLKYWNDKFNLNVSIQFSNYNQVFQELINAGNSRKNALTILLIRFEDWLLYSKTNDDKENIKILDDNFNQLKLFIELNNTENRYILGIFPTDKTFIESSTILKKIDALYIDLYELAINLPNVYISDFCDSSHYGVKEIFDPFSNQEGHIPFTEEFFGYMGLLLARGLNAYFGHSFKLLVLDCDNTLWKGICGEVGAEGIVITKEFSDLQRFVFDLYKKGFLLALCSKNKEADVIQVLETRDDMILRKDHFVSLKVNWQSKSVNIKELASELNIGEESIIFIDDNPVECADVMTNCPKVLTLKIPEQIESINFFLKIIWAFDKVSVTREDMLRTQMYVIDKKRQEFQKIIANLKDYLDYLEINTYISFPSNEDIARLSQLTQRTNQFNLSTIRRDQSQIKEILDDKEYDIFKIEVADKFGEYGLVGLVIAKKEKNYYNIDSFILSCRVLGKGVEDAILHGIVEHAKARMLCNTINANYIPTEKNEPIYNFLELNATLKINDERHTVYQINIDEFRKIHLYGKLHLYKSMPTKTKPILKLSDNSWNGNTAKSNSISKSDVEFEFDVFTINEDKLFHEPHYNLLRTIASKKILTFISTTKTKNGAEDKSVFEYRNLTDKTLIDLWNEILPNKEYSINKNFFEIGGNSLLAIRLMSRIHKFFNVKLVLEDIFKYNTIEKQSDNIRKKLTDSTEKGICKLENQPYYLSSSAQKRIFAIHTINKNSLAYNLSEALVFEGNFDKDKVEAVFQSLISRHESLRTSFEIVDGTVVQIVHNSVVANFDYFEICESEIETSIHSFRQPFILSVPPLIRFNIYRIHSLKHILVIDLHHIIADGTSIDILIREFIELYKKEELVDIPIQYKEYAAWQNNNFKKGIYSDHEKYWISKIITNPVYFKVPTDFPLKKTIDIDKGDYVEFEIDENTYLRIQDCSKKHDATIYMILISAYAILLSKLSNQENIVIGTLTTGRSNFEFERIVGMFVNTIILKFNIFKSYSFGEFIQSVKEEIFESFGYQDYQIDMLSSKLNSDRRNNVNPFFDCLFDLNNIRIQDVLIPDIKVSKYPMQLDKFAKFILALNATELSDKIVFKFRYSIELFKSSTIKLYKDYYLNIIEQVLNNPEIYIKNIQLQYRLSSGLSSKLKKEETDFIF